MKRNLCPRVHHQPNSEAGLTIIESIVAIVVVGILVVAIGPVIALSAATRIQARRIEWGTQAARSYLDGIRSGTIATPPIVLHDPSPTPNNDNGTEVLLDYIEELNSIGVPPSGSLNCNYDSPPSDPFGEPPGYCTTPAPTANFAIYCVDGTGDGKCTTDNFKDFVVQATGIQRDLNADADPDRGYLMGIRVYRADGFSSPAPFEASTATQRATDDTVSGGLGNRKAPVFETVAEVTPEGATYSDLRTRLERRDP